MSAKQDLEDLLESDDELPMTYNEIVDIPAYQDDERFEPIKFHWIDNMQPKTLPVSSNDLKVKSPYLSNDLKDDIKLKIQTLKQDESLLIKKGVLSQRDILCIKSIEQLCNDESLLWFINFLMLKDIQSDYKFLTSCLVNDLSDEYNETKQKNNDDMKNRVSNFRIFLKLF